ncbi:MAG: hypothetical protein KJT01_14185, partial [Gemmatimonadetes bacterium]|nr:hypothetical protein [Gemmatimonadota bacterium]
QLREVARETRRVVRTRVGVDTAVRRQRAEAAVPTAFADTGAAALLRLARAARLRQDSALQSYRATATQRIDMGVGARRLGLEKRLFRGDNVAEIAWRRDVGVRVTPVGSRVASPMGGDADGDIADAVSIPYFPGRETLWFPNSQFGVVRAEIDERELIHPLAAGAEAWYRYALGDSAVITLPDRTVIPLRELRITARRPDRRLFVGSFWFDRRGGELVRAAYRLAAPIEIWDVADEEIARDRADAVVAAPVRDSIARARLARPLFVKDSVARAERAARAARSGDDDAPPAWVKATFRPAKAELEGITVEYGLHEGRFWLPRANSASYLVQFGFMRLPLRLDEAFRYQDVNAAFPLRAIPATRLARAQGDTVNAGDSTTVMDAPATVSVSVGSGAVQGGVTADSAAARAAADTATLSPRERQRARLCARDSVYTRVDSRFEGRLRVAFDMPCNEERLRTSAALPPLDAKDREAFDSPARDALLGVLGLALQPGGAPGRPQLRWGSEFVRYNRVEGLSVGAQLRQGLGGGYTLAATGRIGHADRHANGELALERSAAGRTVTAGVYHRLAASNPDWGGALTLGPSLPALLYGRDEGFYFRAYGAELVDLRTRRGGATRWRLFVERQWAAGDSGVLTTFSMARALTGRRFRDNVIADRMALTGVQADWSRVLRDVVGGVRLTAAVQGEAATGTYSYARGSVEATVSRPVGKLAAALTGAAGTSAGRLPSQRQWFLGGVRTVRGQFPGTLEGNAFWLARAEVGTRQGVVRPVAFLDAGWAGSRRAIGRLQPLRGAGVGVGILDGLFRLDVARGLYPNKGWRSDLYLQATL